MISAADERILTLVGRLHFITVEQVIRRYYSPSSRTTVQSRMKALVELSYLDTVPLRRAGRAGSAPFVYTLSRMGRDMVQGLGHDVGTRYRRAETGQMTGLYMEHTLSVNDVLLAAELIDEQEDDITLLEYLHERDMRRRTRGTIPDAWIDIGAYGYRYPLLLEMDRGTTPGPRLRDKVSSLVSFYRGRYPKLFGVGEATVIFTAPDQKRRQAILQWILDAEPDYSGLFRVTSESPHNALRFFTEPVWYTPGKNQPVLLFDE